MNNLGQDRSDTQFTVKEIGKDTSTTSHAGELDSHEEVIEAS